MSGLKYPFKEDLKKIARAGARNLRISHKNSIEISRFIKGMSTDKAKAYLEDVIKKKRAIPYKKFCKGTPHRKGIGAGKYPVNASKDFLKIIENAEANAENKGLEVKKLIIKHVSANKGGLRFFRGARAFGRRRTKSTNIYMVVGESK